MTVETDFRALLGAHAPLTTLVAQRIAQNAVPEKSPTPVVVFSVQHNPLYAIDGTVVADPSSIAVECWADTGVQAGAVADAVAAALATAPAARAARVLDRSTTFDPDLGLDGVAMTVEWWG